MKRTSKPPHRVKLAAIMVMIALCACLGPSEPEGPPPPPPQPDSPHRIAVISLGGVSDFEEFPARPLKEGMKLFQFTEGPYYTLDAIDLAGDADSAPTEAEEAVRGGADLIVATHPHVLGALMKREVGRPIVFGILGDPLVLGAGEAGDRHRPGLTGAYNPMPASRLLTLVKYYLPRAKRVGVFFDGTRPLSAAHKDALIRDAAPAGLEIAAVDVGSGDGPSGAIDRLLKDPVDAVCLAAGLGTTAQELIAHSARAKVPVFGHREDHVRGGALAAEVPRITRVGLEAGRMAYRILNGEKPEGIPLAQINDTEHVLNRKVAADLGMKLPSGVMRIARDIAGDSSAPSE